jgi:hypothetical protein
LNELAGGTANTIAIALLALAGSILSGLLITHSHQSNNRGTTWEAAVLFNPASSTPMSS